MAETSGFATDLQQSAYLGTTVRRAISAAQQRSHRYVTLEHLLLALTDDPDALALLEGLRVDIAAIRMSAADTVNRNLATLYTPGEFDLRASYKVERVLQTASDDARRLNCAEVDGSFVLAALAREIDSPAADIVKHNGLGFTNAMTWLYGNRGAKFSSRAASAAPAKTAPPTRDAGPPPAQMPERRPFGAPAAAPRDVDGGDGELELEILDEGEPQRPAPRMAPLPQAEAARPQPAPRPQMRPLPQEAPPLAREEAPTQPERRPPPMAQPAPVMRRHEQGPPAVLMRGKDGAPAPLPPKREVPPARGAEDRALPPPQAMPEETGAAGSAAARRAAEPKLPPTARLEEMRLRASGQTPQAPVSTPPVPPPTSKAARKRGAASAGGQQAQAAKRSGQRRAQRPLDVQAGKLVENIPRRMHTAATERVEVRLSREDTEVLTKGLDGRGEPIRHDLLVTSAMSVMLRAPDGGFTIEPLSPETQWIFDGPDAPGGEAFGRWRWAVTPTGRGQRRLQVIVAARSVDANGMVGDTALPEQVITVRVRANILRSVKLGLEWLVVMALGGAITEAVATALHAFGK